METKEETALTNTDKKTLSLSAHEWNREEIDLIKGTVAQGTTDNELKLFLYTAKQTGLNPLLRQIHAVKRWNSALGREAMAIQTGIDGYRLIAERTRRYVPGKEPSYELVDGKLFAATAYVKKFAEGEWHEVAATAHWDEFSQKKKDGTPNSMWAKMPRLMLAKVAEALALRKAFPAEMAGIYTDDEMAQAESSAPIEAPKRAAPAAPKRTPQAGDLVDAELMDEAPTAKAPEPAASTAEVLTVELLPTKIEPIKLSGPGYRYEIDGTPSVGLLHTVNKGFAQALKNAQASGEPVNVYYKVEDGKQVITALT